jgi:hypothetical protein
MSVHEKAHALTAFRELPNGAGRQYTATTFPEDPWQGCERFIRTGLKLGLLKDPGDGDSYAVLDVLDEDWSIVQDFAVPDAHAFRWVKRKLGLRVDMDDALAEPGGRDRGGV